VAPFYQADALTGAPNCAASFLTGSNFARSIQRNVLSPPPEPAAAVAVGAGGTSLRFSTLEIQPGAGEVTQMTVSTSSEMLQMMYSMPLSVDQHLCRHMSPANCH
jgi:type IV pilus assembly protein PilY1